MSDAPEDTIDAAESRGAWSSADPTLAPEPAGSNETGRSKNLDLERGAAVGRYVVLERLGAGAMGVVLSAYDPELDRKVAIKLLRRTSSAHHELARARLQREAQALARLNHPNVVGVHDVGVHDGHVFLAMEFVQGRTLEEWLDEDTHTWREVVEVFEAAGRGLAAAHAEGLIHRDFKPDNVMIGVDGRVRVMDFGLATASEVARDEGTAVHGGTSLRGGLSSSLTQTGSLLGTPAYMAPEQFSGGEVTPRSDQFGYCIALFEALHGSRPFCGDTVEQLALSVTRGRIAEDPGAAAVPGWLRRVVRRGLATDPAQRFPDMPSLLAAIAAGDVRRRRGRVAAAVGIVVLVVAGVFGLRHWDEAARRQACIEATAQTLDVVWNPTVRQSLHDGLLASGVGYAAMTADKVAAYVDEQAHALSHAQTQACLDTRVRAVWSEAVLERASWCLEERRMQLQALVEELSHADRASVENAVVAASQLSPVAPCRDRTRLERGAAPPDDREAAQALHGAVSKAMALKSAGKYDQGLRVVRQAIAEYEPLGPPGLIASARVELGGLLADTGELEMAEEALVAAYFDAVRAGEDEVSAEAALDLAYLLGDYLARRREAERWFQHSIVALDELGEPEGSLRRARALRYLGLARQAAGGYEEAKDLFEQVLAMHEHILGPDHLRQAQVLDSLAVLHEEMGELEKAKAINERVLGIKERTLGSEHPRVADSLVNLANVAQSMGHIDEARALGQRALAIREQALGPDHADIAVVVNNLANIAQETGDYARAKELHGRALSILETSLGPEHPHVATSLNNLGNVASSMGAYDDARGLHERALQIREEALGAEHRDVAMSLNNLANVQKNLGDLGAAKALHERALRIWEKVLGPEHADVALSLDNLADVHRLMGDHEQERTLHERALVIWEKTVGPSHPRLAYALLPLARLALRDARFGEAVSLAERAVEVCPSPDGSVDLYAGSRYVLARALWAAGEGEGRDRARALDLARQARDALRDAPAEREALTEVTDWIAGHSPAKRDR